MGKTPYQILKQLQESGELNTLVRAGLMPPYAHAIIAANERDTSKRGALTKAAKELNVSKYTYCRYKKMGK
jgi:hypothetical protein